MNFIILNILKNIGTAMIAKPMLFWGARFAAKNTKTSLDDEFVNLVEAGYDNDLEKMQQSIKRIGESIEELLKEKRA